LKNKLNFPDYGASSHQKLIDNLLAYNDRDHKLVGKKLESLFLKRKIADYKYHEEVKSHSCQYCIQEAEAIISLFNKIQTTP